MIKYTLTALVCVLLLSCGGEKPTDDVEIKKAELAEKTKELAALQTEINQLQSEIDIMEPKREKEALPVTVLNIEKKEFKRFIDLQAYVTTDEVVNASSDMGGRILRLYVKEGQSVKKGQLIATTDAEGLDKQKDELKKSLDLAVDVFDRQKRLWEQNIGSEIQYLQAKNNKERIEKTMQTLDVQYRKRNVYAPISGTVDKVFLKEGELSGPASPIVQMLNISKVKIVSDVPETFIGKVKVGDNVNIQFPALDKELNKKVSLLGRTIDPSNRTFKMEINMDNPNGELKPNLLSIVKINDITVKDALAIPVDYIQQEVSGKKFVFVIKESDGKKRAQKAYVTTGESADNSIIITEGLAAGDLVILKGARSVLSGQPVIIESN
ncbi:MAG: efflux RND transporter periplasmic adaptor subunit [Saprospiraceae bacterium]